MSANASILEGGKGYTFGPVKCLMVEGNNGEFFPWYSEADRALDSLSVTQNGIYRANDRGVYGWSRVSVNVQADSVTGRDPETGDEKTVTVDPGTGELVETVVPVEIRIETPPTFTGPYGDGAYIDFTGLTVAAYGANGDKMLDVPFNELILPVTTAMPGEVIEVFDDELVPPVYLLPASVGNTIAEYEVGGDWYRYYYTGVSGGPVYLVCIKDDGAGREESVFVSMNQFAVSWERTHPGGWDPHRGGASGAVATYEEYSAYVGGNIMGANLFVEGGYSPISAFQPIGLVNAAILAINKVAAGEAVSVATVPVQWSRTGDGKILETSFEITVTGGD